MIFTEHPYVDKKGVSHENLVKTSSDEGKYILQNETGNKYRIAIDTYPCKYTYTETDEVAPPMRTFTKKEVV